MPSFKVAELAERVSGAVEGDPERRVSGVAAVADAGPEDLTFLSDPRYRRALEAARPAAVLAGPDLVAPSGVTVIRVPNPQRAFGRLLPLFHPPRRPPSGIDPTARLGRGVVLGEAVSIGPGVLIGDRVRVGDGSAIGAFTVVEDDVRIGGGCRIAHGCSLMRGVRIGDRVQLHPGVRVGTDGFGYAEGPNGAEKIPQVGGCVLGDDVEVGANSTIDRGALGDTVVGQGTKIDNLVHIGHNVKIGESCMIVAQVGVAGSTTIGHGVALAGQAGVAGHLTIGDGARIAAQAGVIGDVPAGATFSGYPARPHREAMRASANLFRLPELLRRLRAVERELGIGEGNGTGGEGNP